VFFFVFHFILYFKGISLSRKIKIQFCKLFLFPLKCYIFINDNHLIKRRFTFTKLLTYKCFIVIYFMLILLSNLLISSISCYTYVSERYSITSLSLKQEREREKKHTRTNWIETTLKKEVKNTHDNLTNTCDHQHTLWTQWHLCGRCRAISTFSTLIHIVGLFNYFYSKLARIWDSIYRFAWYVYI